MAEVVKSGEDVLGGESISPTNPLPVQAFLGMNVEDMAEVLRLLSAIESHLSSITELTFEGD